jgi:hypothetical protein
MLKEVDGVPPAVACAGLVIGFRPRVVQEGMAGILIHAHSIGKVCFLDGGQQGGNVRHDERILASVDQEEWSEYIELNQQWFEDREVVRERIGELQPA